MLYTVLHTIAPAPAIILQRGNELENRQILTSSTQIFRKLLVQIKISKRLTEEYFELYKMGE